MRDPYFDRPPPKSLDRNHFAAAAAAVEPLGDADGAATLAAFTVEATAAALRQAPAAPKRWLVGGGGRRNPFLMRRLAERLGVRVEPVEAIGFDGDAIEAQCFAYLALALAPRRCRSPSRRRPAFPTPMTGGVFWPAPAIKQRAPLPRGPSSMRAQTRLVYWQTLTVLGRRYNCRRRIVESGDPASSRPPYPATHNRGKCAMAQRAGRDPGDDRGTPPAAVPVAAAPVARMPDADRRAKHRRRASRRHASRRRASRRRATAAAMPTAAAAVPLRRAPARSSRPPAAPSAQRRHSWRQSPWKPVAHLTLRWPPPRARPTNARVSREVPADASSRWCTPIRHPFCSKNGNLAPQTRIHPL